MKKITYCKKCLYPDTKPNLFINKEGVCSACTNYTNRKTIQKITKNFFNNIVFSLI